MSDLLKKVSYLKGYADGLDISPKSDEGKLLLKFIDVMDKMAQEIGELTKRCNDLQQITAELEEDVMDLTNEIYDDDWDDDDDDGDPFWDDDKTAAWLDEDDSDLFEIQCPNCGEDVVIDYDMLDNGNDIVCPMCHENIELELDFGDDDNGEEEE